MSRFLEKAREKIRNDRISESLEIVEKNFKEIDVEYQNEIVKYISDLKKISKESRLDVLSEEQKQLKYSKLKVSLLLTLTEIEKNISSYSRDMSTDSEKSDSKSIEDIKEELSRIFEEKSFDLHRKNSNTIQIISFILLLGLLFSTIYLINTTLNNNKRNETVFVDTFPHNLIEITALITSAKENVVIATDVSSYGVLSSYRLFSDYQKSITKLLTDNKNLEIELITLNDSMETELIKIEIGTNDEDYLNFKQNPKFKDFFSENPEIENLKMLKDALIRYSHNFEFKIASSENKSRILVRDLFYDIPIHIWMIDDREAIFSFYDQIERKTEASFYTNDPKLIFVLQNYIDSFREKSNLLSQDDLIDTMQVQKKRSNIYDRKGGIGVNQK